MFKFLKKIIANYIGSFLFFLTLFCVGFSFVAHIYKEKFEAHYAINKTIRKAQNQVLYLKLNGNLRSRRSYKGLEIEDGNIYLNELRETLAHSAKNPKIKGLLIELAELKFHGLVELDALVDLLQTFKKSGKPIVCYSTNCNQLTLYIASQADYHVMYPLGEVNLLGLSRMRYYYKGLLDKVGVQFEIFKVGKNKDYSEHLTHKSMSPSVKKSSLAFLRSIDQRYLKKIAQGRHMSVAALQALRQNQIDFYKAQEEKYASEKGKINIVKDIKRLGAQVAPKLSMAWLSAEEAQNLGLVDQLGYLPEAEFFFYDKSALKLKSNKEGTNATPQMEKESPKEELNSEKKASPTAEASEKEEPPSKEAITAKVEKEAPKKILTLREKKKLAENEPNTTPLMIPHHYYRLYYMKKPKPRKINLAHHAKVNVILLEGEIRLGESRRGVIGATDTIEALYAASDNTDVLFVEINSPGGSAEASDKIREALVHIRRQGTYVVAVMGSLCASGGLLIAYGANEIWIREGTIAGSLGVTMAYPIWEEFMHKKLDVHVDGVKTSPYADLKSAHYRTLKEEEKKVYQKFTNLHFEHFVKQGQREGKLTKEQVLAFAGGQVFLGKKAYEYGIADKIIYNLEDEIDILMKKRFPDHEYVLEYDGEKIRLYALLFSLRLFFLKSILGKELYQQYEKIIQATSQKREVKALYTGSQSF